MDDARKEAWNRAMIHVNPRSEPGSFNQSVRIPGQVWLKANPKKTKGEIIPAYWRACLPDLRSSYKGICAYFACYVKPATGAQSADHFVAKSAKRSLAYEWDNYRFACSRMNARKNDASDVLDPFTLVDGWFVLQFLTMTVHPSTGLSPQQRKKVIATRDRLDLNSAECIKEREEAWDDYYTHGLHVNRLIEYAPFVAIEAVRQGLLLPRDAKLTVQQIRAWLDSP